MRVLILAALFLTSITSAKAAEGDITTSGQIPATCSVGDVNITLSKEGNNKLKGTGSLSISQTGRTKWEIGKTTATSGSSFTSRVELAGPGRITFLSPQLGGQKNTFNDGAFVHSGKVDVVLTSLGLSLSPGSYGTKTTVQCTVQ